jgi:2-methylcitrate dehydratase PrpD
VGRNSTKASPTMALGQFTAALQSQKLPSEVTFKLGQLFLDYLRVASIGARMPWSAWARSYQSRLGGRGRSNILFSRHTTNPVQAAFLNATFAGSIDSDDTHVGSMLHPGAIVFSAAFAMATDVDASGSRFLTAVAAGYEVMIRIALAIQPSHFQRGFQSTSTCGGFGAAAAAAVLLNAEQNLEQSVAQSFGIVASFAGGLTQFYQSGSTVKRIHAAHAAECGVGAALLVSHGFSGPTDILEGSNGFGRAYADDSDFGLLQRELGTHFRLMEVMVKGHACSARVQAAVEAILALAKSDPFDPSDIASIHVGIPKVIIGRLTCSHPVDLQAAQMSLPFSVALAVRKVSRDPGSAVLEIQDFEDGLRDDTVRAIEDRVICEFDHDVEARSTAEAVAAKVVLTLNSGREIGTFVDAPLGSPSRPVSHDQQVQRFRNELSGRLSPAACNSLIILSQRIGQLDSMERITALLRPENEGDVMALEDLQDKERDVR